MERKKAAKSGKVVEDAKFLNQMHRRGEWRMKRGNGAQRLANIFYGTRRKDIETV